MSSEKMEICFEEVQIVTSSNTTPVAENVSEICFKLPISNPNKYTVCLDAVGGSKSEGNKKESKKYRCLYCPFITSIYSTLEYHMLAHEDKQAFSCEGCNKTFTYDWSLRRHLSKCAANETQPPASKIRKM